ncbi:YaaA family protein [uncultured Schumannella sp.]|uniref:YaaA family protein n=1 Tax=uncultured Schumannella sp. TaxID=1195956 RepID=UPI0025FE438E|nr:peroxide stress protein YaaA [uncultured Schumannella sp.]
MILLLPPSETKRPGGVVGTRLELDGLSFPSLGAPRRAALSALRELCADDAAARRALKLGATQLALIEVNRDVERSATMPALDRFDGVLFDALDAATLSAEARRRAGESVLIGSALFGLVGALDAIPAYRLSADSKLPGLALRRHWADEAAAALAERAAGGFVLDARSEAYAALGPAPAGSRFLRVVAEGEDGRRRALNHFNKAGKGALARALLAGPSWPEDESDLLDWARDAGVRLEAGDAGELVLIAEHRAAA